jgi:hypothetical protein
MARRDWGRARARDLKSRALRDEMDASRYVAEREAPRYKRRRTRGPATLRCTCGHSGRVNIAEHKRFRCTHCGQLWLL